MPIKKNTINETMKVWRFPSENDNEVTIGIIKVPANIINIMPIILFIIR